VEQRDEPGRSAASPVMRVTRRRRKVSSLASVPLIASSSTPSAEAPVSSTLTT
jgi:hypothetical protein